MSPRLANKTAIITGAGSGIGSAIATLFAREGARRRCLIATHTAAKRWRRSYSSSPASAVWPAQPMSRSRSRLAARYSRAAGAGRY